MKCPFYIREEPRYGIRIVCEGPVDGTTGHLMFPSLELMSQHKEQYCNRCYNDCPVARMLNQKHEYEP